jgi:hypothetical protein
MKALVAVALLLPALSHAHGRSVSYSAWTPTPSGAHVDLRVAAVDLTLLEMDPFAADDVVGAWATKHLVAESANGACTPSAPPRRAERGDGWILLAWDVACPGPPRAITSRLFADVAPSHIHLARLAGAGGQGATERVLTADAPRWPLDAEAPAKTAATFGDYVGLGLEHIRSSRYSA